MSENKVVKEDIFKGIAPTDPIMKGMWYGCISFGLGKTEIMDQFRKDTGNNYRVSSNPIDKAIDEATGVDKAFLKEFAVWMNKNYWGPTN